MKTLGKALAPIFSGGQPLENSRTQMEGWMVETGACKEAANYVTSLLSLPENQVSGSHFCSLYSSENKS